MKIALIKKSLNLFAAHHKPALVLASDKFKFISSKNSKVGNSENDKNADFLVELENKINEGNEISRRCNQKIAEAKAKYPFLNTPSKVYQPGGEFHHLVPWHGDDNNNDQAVSESDLPTPYDKVVNSDLPPPYDKVVNSDLPPPYDKVVNSDLPPPYDKVVKSDLPLPYDKVVNSDLPPPYDEAVRNNELNTPKSKSFFSFFSSPLKTIYELGADSFNIIKDKVSNISTSVLSSKITVAFNFVNNKVLPSLGINVKNASDDDRLVKEIISTPENKLNAVLEKITYEKFADIINNTSDEQGNKLINYILPEHFEKVIKLISSDKLNKLFDKNANGLTLDELTEQELKKLSDKNISDAKIKDIITLAGEEKFVENIIKNSANIPSKNLEVIFSNISAKGNIEILNSFIELSGIAAEAA